MRRTKGDLRGRSSRARQTLARGPFSWRASVVVALSIVGLYAGCTTNTATETGDPTTTTVTGTGAMGPCYSNIPDGQCLPDGEPNAERCACADCAGTAKCNGGCSDDGDCNL